MQYKEHKEHKKHKKYKKHKKNETEQKKKYKELKAMHKKLVKILSGKKLFVCLILFLHLFKPNSRFFL